MMAQVLETSWAITTLFIRWSFSGGSDTQNILTGFIQMYLEATQTRVIPLLRSQLVAVMMVDLMAAVTLIQVIPLMKMATKSVTLRAMFIILRQRYVSLRKKKKRLMELQVQAIGTGTSGESFDDVLKRVVMAAPDVAPISANVKPMQEGGMAGLNRAADNFLQALAG